jgi:hypothetical protein
MLADCKFRRYNLNDKQGSGAMNYQKLDASLSAVLNDERASDERDLVVFVRTQEPPDAQQKQEMEQLGIKGVEPARKVFTAQLSRRAVSELSDKPWVQQLSLSQQLKPLSKG